MGQGESMLSLHDIYLQEGACMGGGYYLYMIYIY